MKTIFILLDSLNRHYLPAYGCDWVQTPNIDRLESRGVVFDNHYCCSMPCIPARRDLFTGRACFLETPGSPIQPWDDCLQPELRRQNGTYSHLITDHFHYFHSGGEGYHTRFDSYEFQRGQTWDQWHALVKDPEPPPHRGGTGRRPYWVNREFYDSERDEDFPTPQCFIRALEFLANNHEQDNWHLHLEVFDPHEPFACPRKYRELYDDEWDDRYHFDWPDYGRGRSRVTEEPEAVDHIRKRYAGTLTMADVWLGKLLDRMDALDMWKDTVVVLTTDHGHLLGEHGYWGKNYMFDYRELVHIPLIVCSPASAQHRTSALTSTLDLMPTFMELHRAEPPPQVHGKSLCHILDGDEDHHDTVLYGYFGKDMNVADGRYTYCRQPLPDSFLYHHTLMPCANLDFHDRDTLAQAESGVFLESAHGIPHLRIKTPSHRHDDAPEFNPIYDITSDPQQQDPIRDPKLEAELAGRMKEQLQRFGAPECQYARLGL